MRSMPIALMSQKIYISYEGTKISTTQDHTTHFKGVHQFVLSYQKTTTKIKLYRVHYMWKQHRSSIPLL